MHLLSKNTVVKFQFCMDMRGQITKNAEVYKFIITCKGHFIRNMCESLWLQIHRLHTLTHRRKTMTCSFQNHIYE
jgi:hypothetical protein